MQAFLLAAGLGTRLRPYSLVRPKPLFPICNVPLLQLLVDKLRAAGCTRVLVNSHHLAEQIAAAVAGQKDLILQHEPELLGTGGSLRQALPLLHEDQPLLVVNGDIYHDIHLKELLEQHLVQGSAVTLALHDLPRFNQVRVQGHQVSGFGHGKAEKCLAFTGVHIVQPAVLRAIPPRKFFHIIDLYQELAEQGQVGYQRVDGCFWQDIGTPEDYFALHRRLLQGWVLSTQARIGSGVVFKDWGTLGPGAKVGAKAQLSRCIVWDGAKIPAGVQLADQIILPGFEYKLFSTS